MTYHTIKKNICKSLLPALCVYSAMAHADAVALMKTGIWEDRKNDLMWARCNLGQNWDGHACAGESIRVTYTNVGKFVKIYNTNVALGAYSDWRLPTIDELMMLRKCSKQWARESNNKTKLALLTVIPNKRGLQKKVQALCARGSIAPVINQRTFPDTKKSYGYWSSTENADNQTHWGVNFSGGFAFNAGENYSAYVKLVRDNRQK
ncbi:MAG: hypothetical protein CR962_00045 [Gammaproteobacteria bacterium]|nr:MAG: hypothetical protein CR962_00045 [Gammaproteobacteria bacterium]